MNKFVAYLIAAFVVLSLLMSAGPTLVALTDAAVPLVIAIGIVVAVLRLVWHYTNHY